MSKKYYLEIESYDPDAAKKYCWVDPEYKCQIVLGTNGDGTKAIEVHDVHFKNVALYRSIEDWRQDPGYCSEGGCKVNLALENGEPTGKCEAGHEWSDWSHEEFFVGDRVSVKLPAWEYSCPGTVKERTAKGI